MFCLVLPQFLLQNSLRATTRPIAIYVHVCLFVVKIVGFFTSFVQTGVKALDRSQFLSKKTCSFHRRRNEVEYWRKEHVL